MSTHWVRSTAAACTNRLRRQRGSGTRPLLGCLFHCWGKRFLQSSKFWLLQSPLYVRNLSVTSSFKFKVTLPVLVEVYFVEIWLIAVCVLKIALQFYFIHFIIYYINVLRQVNKSCSKHILPKNVFSVLQQNDKNAYKL